MGDFKNIPDINTFDPHYTSTLTSTFFIAFGRSNYVSPRHENHRNSKILCKSNPTHFRTVFINKN